MSLIVKNILQKHKKTLPMAFGFWPDKILFSVRHTWCVASLLLSLSPSLDSSVSPVLVIRPISSKKRFYSIFIIAILIVWILIDNVMMPFLRLDNKFRNSTKRNIHGGPSVMVGSLTIGSTTYSAQALLTVILSTRHLQGHWRNVLVVCWSVLTVQSHLVFHSKQAAFDWIWTKTKWVHFSGHHN